MVPPSPTIRLLPTCRKMPISLDPWPKLPAAMEIVLVLIPPTTAPIATKKPELLLIPDPPKISEAMIFGALTVPPETLTP